MKRRVLVLGGRGDIGAAIVDRFSVLGHAVLAVGREEFDLSDGQAIDRFLQEYDVDFDVLVHSAGWNVPGAFETMSIADLRHAIEANLVGFLRLVQGLLPYWKTTGCGHIVVLSSLYGFISRRGRLPYAVSKHGLMAAVKTLGIELAPLGVMVNAVTPGYIDTKLTRQNNPPEVIARLAGGVPVGRLGLPAEVAGAVAFLASVDNTYITGQELVVDGGYSVGGFQG